MFSVFKQVRETDTGDAEKTQLKFLCMKTIISEIKYIDTLDGVNVRKIRQSRRGD